MTKQEIGKAVREYAQSLDSIAFENLSGEEIPYLLKGAFKEGLESANKHWQEKTRWIPVEERLPKYGVAVLVKRPNKYSGNVDILLSRLHQAKKEGQEYGRGDGIGSYPKTFKDYWSLPSIALLGDITHWKEIE